MRKNAPRPALDANRQERLTAANVIMLVLVGGMLSLFLFGSFAFSAMV